MKTFGETEALIFHEEICTYADLLKLLDGWRSRLAGHEVRPGQVVALEATYSPETCAGLLALVERGAIVVPMTGLPEAKRREFEEISQAEAVLTVDGEHNTVKFHRTGRRARHEIYERLRAGRTPGLVLFSSGTTGRSKASVLDFSKVLQRYGEPVKPRRTLSFMNIDHIGGINTLLHTLSQGGTLVTVAERTPDAVFSAVAAHRVEVLPTTPTFLNMVLISGAHERHDTSSLRLITYGTEPMPEQTLRALRRALPAVRLKQTYGLSELGILPTKSRGDDTLWVKLGQSAGFEYKIVDSVLRIRSDMAMLGYLNAPAPFDEEGWFDTQDVVETDGEWVRILGRTSEIINVGGEKVYPVEVEGVLLEVPNITDVVVSGRPSPVTGMVVAATVSLAAPEERASVARRIRAYCAGRLEPFKIPAAIDIAGTAQHSDRFKKIRSTV
ncbi:class I adenylate-forming enzyme family protein [Streptomyces sp. NPDC096205]|uniref:class I adenylate-forming enzyme family protein n=1 Tax=Streptomyces sp. NPDC096205 TaxID=3366081 RepID=UPI0038273E50